MPTTIEVGALPLGTLPIAWLGGLATALSSSPSEISRTEITNPVTGARIYKKVVMGEPSVTVTLQGGTPPVIGAVVDLSVFGIAAGAYRAVSNAPNGASSEVASYSVVCEDFEV